MPELACINGNFCPIDEATVSINDRGFQFADSVYEVIVAYDGKPFLMNEHLERLSRSLSLCDMPMDLDELKIEQLIADGLSRSAFSATVIYIQITRGVQERNHLYRDGLTPTVLLTFREKPAADPDRYRDGVGLMSTEDQRWAMCEIKATGLLPNVLAKNRAVRAGFQDAVLVTSDGLVRECTASNIFVIHAGALITPVADESILHGITRDYVLRCAALANVPTDERSMTVEELCGSDEAFISSTMVDILPVTRIDQQNVGDGTVGPVTRALMAAYRQGMPHAAQPA